MASYVVPQVEIHQLFSEIPVALANNQVPFVFGPNFLLHRYEDSTEKITTLVEDVYTSETASGFFSAYPAVLDDEKVDQSYTKLFGDNVIVKLASYTGISTVTGEPDKIKVTADTVTQKEFAVGRYLRIYQADGSDSDSSPDSYIDVFIKDIDEDKTTSEAICLVLSEELAFSTFYKLDLCEVQNGVEFPSEDVTDENKTRYFWKQEKCSSTDPTHKYYNRMGISIKTPLKAKIVDSDFIEGDESYGDVYSADLYITTRELITSSSDTIHALTNATEVTAALGAISPDNPLAQAVYNAALNAGGQTIRYMAVPTNDKDGYEAVLNKATLTKEVYFLVPVTRERKIQDLVQAHVDSMSAPTSKRWRIAFVSADIPDEDPIYNALNSTSGKDFKAMVIAKNEVDKTSDVKFVIRNGNEWVADPNTAFTKDLVVGDVLYFNFHTEWGEEVPSKYLIKKIVNKYTIRVKGVLPLPEDPSAEAAAKKAEIVHIYTNAEKAEVIRNLSSSFAFRRIYNVFPSVFSCGGVMQTGEFAAAAVAGLVSSCLPQQPVTNLELVGIDDIPLVYQTFSMAELNTMASGGTFIVMQDLPNDQVYVRHQISTDYEANNLNTAELSITKNLDSISYFFDDLLSPYIGKYNITPELLGVLHATIQSGITSLSSTNYGLYGPQLIADGTSILLLEQDALLKDHVNCNLQLNMPYPFNHLVLKLFV